MTRRHCTWGLLLLSACAHGEATQPKPSSPEATTHATAPASTPAPTTLPDAGVRAPLSKLEDYMIDHYAIVTLSRDAVIGGSLEGLRLPLLTFAEHEYADVAAGAWMPWIAKLQEAALLTAQAETLERAAMGVATMARECGACHTAGARGPVFATHAALQLQPRNSFDARMGRHMWAAERLWEGLVGPDDEAWLAGASALAKISSTAPTGHGAVPPAFATALLDVRTLGQKALEASNQAERADVYGLMLAGCASCHAQQIAFGF